MRTEFELVEQNQLTPPTSWPTKDAMKLCYSYDWVCRPTMLIYEREEMSQFLFCIGPPGFFINDENDEDERSTMVEQGRLDLTGRHESRWNEYIPGFEAYIQDFDALAPFLYKEKKCSPMWTGTFHTVTYRVKPEGEDTYRQWLSRWKIEHDQGDLADIIARSLDVHALWLKGSKPQFQSITLIDLPEDILEVVFSECSREELFIVSGTCTTLRWARDHCLKACEIRFTQFMGSLCEKLDPESDLPRQIIPYFIKAYGLCLDRIAYYAARSKQCAIMEKLVINLCWTSGTHYGSPVYQALKGAYWERVVKSLSKAIIPLIGSKGTPNLTQLSLTGVLLDGHELLAVCSLGKLRTLSLFECKVTAIDTLTKWLEGNTLSLSSPVANLHIRFGPYRPGPPSSQWVVLRLLPNIRNLSLESIDYANGFVLPEDSEFYSQLRCLDSLERLAVTHIRSESVGSLASWLLMRRPFHSDTIADKLTHFEIVNDVHIPLEGMQLLLRSLRSNRLEVLTLYGIQRQFARPELIGEIAQLCPNLLSLRLIAHGSLQAKYPKPIVWAAPSWSYAALFAGFNCLEHFKWNYLIPVEDPTPFPLVHFEMEAMEPVATAFPGELWPSEVDDSTLYFGDNHLSAAPFVAHCPTLESFYLDNDSLCCEIIRWVEDDLGCDVHSPGVDFEEAATGGVGGRVEIRDVTQSRREYEGAWSWDGL
ncbi:hypothetical protein CC1G_14115 [Coprinopsis cinerea okayama7|uniref:F-box domain-containing protein n=1 Tax=Coprinopsis cinerea (strain Okayama-7 / 130 / ATCC MYA-4618 / FGSC 9003) TaxID=240176 RepID=D6RLJ6_COPC7|nr:hypothetical protein CC1G_14115 [Coprinopsis cinerea okayama7\|eukprot:XP_002911582.1 hypothetical protein CC1G_14115 [Coprinopsis cinerea okayama7\